MVTELVDIQQELKAPKGQYNKFGKYKYRSCEDIMESVKPILKKVKCSLVVSDDVVEIGGRIYVKATATLTNSKGDSVSSCAFAREADKKAGMDDSQLTGSCSSYARKYALNGLFAIDDTKDMDALNKHGEEKDDENDENLTLALDDIRRANDVGSLAQIYKNYEGYQGNKIFMNALSTRRKEIENGKAA